MNAANFKLSALLAMKHSPVRNYAIPGLTSWLIGQPSEAGTVRLFECSREHQECITPHSHRFNFQCWVLRGEVRNRVWRKKYDDSGDFFQSSELHYKGQIGEFEKKQGDCRKWGFQDRVYNAGECYSMDHDEVHSIFFSRDALVLFFEGPTCSDSSIIIEPYVNGETIPTFKVEPWMFRRPTASQSTGDSAAEQKEPG